MKKMILNFFSKTDVLMNLIASSIFIIAVLIYTALIDHVLVAKELLNFSIGMIVSWLLTLGGPTRYVNFLNYSTIRLASAVWQTLILSVVLIFFMFGTIQIMIICGATFNLIKIYSVINILPFVMLGFLGKEVSNLYYGRKRTAFIYFGQATTALCMSLLLYFTDYLQKEESFLFFLCVYYSSGGVQLIKFLYMYKMTSRDISLDFMKDTVSKHLLVGFSTLLLGNFDKIILSTKATLASSDAVYMIADRLATIYSTVMNYYTQSRVQEEIGASNSDAVTLNLQKSLRLWMKDSLALFVSFFFMLASVLLTYAFFMRDVPESILLLSILLLICFIYYVKNGCGFAIRLMDSRGSGVKFNEIAIRLILVATVFCFVLPRKDIIVISIIKLLLHIYMFVELSFALRSWSLNGNHR